MSWHSDCGNPPHSSQAKCRQISWMMGGESHVSDSSSNCKFQALYGITVVWDAAFLNRFDTMFLFLFVEKYKFLKFNFCGLPQDISCSLAIYDGMMSGKWQFLKFHLGDQMSRMAVHNIPGGWRGYSSLPPPSLLSLIKLFNILI